MTPRLFLVGIERETEKPLFKAAFWFPKVFTGLTKTIISDNNKIMALSTKSKLSTSSETPTISIPITIAQIAEGLRNVSKSELETLELLLDKKAIQIIEKSRNEVNQGKFKKL